MLSSFAGAVRGARKRNAAGLQGSCLRDRSSHVRGRDEGAGGVMRMRGRVRPSAAAVMLAAALAGCTTPQFAPPQAGMPLPQSWQETEAAPAALDLASYWRQLDDPLLTEFVEAAAAH